MHPRNAYIRLNYFYNETMGRFIDFRITVDDENDPELGKKIVEHLTYRKLQAKKPVVWFIGGSSGEGKSYTAIKIMDIVNNLFGIDTVEYLNEQLIYVPIEYATKMNNILFSKDMKKVRAIMIDEGRELLPAKLWYNFVNQAIADINAMSRGVKSLLLIIISQYFKDIDTSVRRTITYYSKCYRPLSGSKVSFTPYTIWEDDRDIDGSRKDMGCYPYLHEYDTKHFSPGWQWPSFPVLTNDGTYSGTHDPLTGELYQQA